MSQQKSPANIYSTSQLKATSDDHIPVVLEAMGYKREHSLENFRLFIGYSSIVVSAICAYWDYYVGFHKRFVPITMCVIVYTALSVAYQVWTWKVERGLVYSGQKGKSRVNIRTKTKRHSAEYDVSVEFVNAQGYELKEHNVKGAFNGWFDNRGFIVYSKFQQFIQDAVSEEKKTN